MFDFRTFKQFFELKTPFCFIRFSDGEMEVIRNRVLSITPGATVFRGRKFNNHFSTHETKMFSPIETQHRMLRKDLIAAATFSGTHFFKGCPGFHNLAREDHDLLIRLNGKNDERLTHSDLLVNENYISMQCLLKKMPSLYNKTAIIANHAARPSAVLGKTEMVAVPDNLFDKYEETLLHVVESISKLKKGSIVLSSASSLSNIVGHKVWLVRKDITFIDVGSAINPFLGLGSQRDYFYPKKWNLMSLFSANKMSF